MEDRVSNIRWVRSSGEGSIIDSAVIGMDDSQLTTIDRVPTFLGGHCCSRIPTLRHSRGLLQVNAKVA